MAGLDLDLGAALPAEGERCGRFRHRQTTDPDLGQIGRRGPSQRAGNHVQGGQGTGQISPVQSLDLHLPRSNDRSHLGLSLHPVLLLEIVPEQQQQQCPAYSISNGTNGPTDGLQHDGRPHSPMKTIDFFFLYS